METLLALALVALLWKFAGAFADAFGKLAAEATWQRLARRATIPNMGSLIPDEEGKIHGWKEPAGVRKNGDPQRPNACPFCGTEVEAVGRLGQPIFGEGDQSPEPWRNVAECLKCDAKLERHEGEPWTVTSA